MAQTSRLTVVIGQAGGLSLGIPLLTIIIQIPDPVPWIERTILTIFVPPLRFLSRMR